MDTTRVDLPRTVRQRTDEIDLGIAPLAKSQSEERRLLTCLLGLTFVTGLVDAASYVGMGHVFTANMTGNVVFLAFALAGVPGLSAVRCLLAIAGFAAGAALEAYLFRGSTGASRESRLATACVVEASLLGSAALVSFAIPAGSNGLDARLCAAIVITALAMGVRNAAVRTLGVPDMTTTVLTLTITGLAADSVAGEGRVPRWPRRFGSVLAIASGAAIGALLVAAGLRHALVVSAAIGVVVAFAVSKLGASDEVPGR